VPGDDDLLIGRIVGVHGVRGNLKMLSFADSLNIFSPGKRITVLTRNGVPQAYTVRWVRPHHRLALMSLEEVKDRDQASALSGSDVYIARSDLPEIDADTYYWADLIGMTVCDESGACLGELTRILRTGSNDVYVVRDSLSERLIPAVAGVILTVDIAEKTMTVALPEGL